MIVNVIRNGTLVLRFKDAEVRASPLLPGMVEVRGPAYTWRMKYETIHSRFAGTWIEKLFGGWWCDFSREVWLGEAGWVYDRDMHLHLPVGDVSIEESEEE